MKDSILQLRREGKSYREISRITGLGKSTIEYHCNTAKCLQKQRARRKSLKEELVSRYGGRCSICGYNKSLSALDFHHKDGEDKDFQIGRYVQDRGITPDLLIELRKCILVCSNCHHEIHDDLCVNGLSRNPGRKIVALLQ